MAEFLTGLSGVDPEAEILQVSLGLNGIDTFSVLGSGALSLNGIAVENAAAPTLMTHDQIKLFASLAKHVDTPLSPVFLNTNAKFYYPNGTLNAGRTPTVFGQLSLIEPLRPHLFFVRLTGNRSFGLASIPASLDPVFSRYEQTVLRGEVANPYAITALALRGADNHNAVFWLARTGSGPSTVTDHTTEAWPPLPIPKIVVGMLEDDAIALLQKKTDRSIRKR